MKLVVLAALLLAVRLGPILAVAQDFPLALENLHSGISLALSGANGVDWAVELGDHDPSISEQTLYLRGSVDLSLAHNERNALTIDVAGKARVLGTAGWDGTAGSGDEGDIYYKIDRDLQAHRYSTKSGALTGFCVRYQTPFRFDALTYDGTQPVLGAVGDNGVAWGSTPKATTARSAYGQRDESGNEWHTLTYWDDDEPLLAAAKVDSQRLGASDGHAVFVCVNPVTPVIQLHAEGSEQFHTTPVKTYHVPRTWQRTTTLTGGVRLGFVNLTNGAAVQFRVGDGPWQAYDGTPLTAAALFGDASASAVLEARCGANGAVYRRTVVVNPGVPAPEERHGFLLWADEAERLAVAQKVHDVQPFKTSYTSFRSSYYQGSGTTFNDTRGAWRAAAGSASTALANAFVVAIEGPAAALDEARLAKTRLLRLGRLQPVGFEDDINNATPSKDFLNELGQTLQQFADAGVAYDLLAAHFRTTNHPEGMTPIEELRIREGLAKIAKTILQMRANWSATSGAGDTHWSHGYELAIGTVALAMPTYRSALYGVSGGDRISRNTSPAADGTFWNPFPTQGITWYEAATDPAVPTPGHPNVRYPFRAEFLLTDDGWWTGPNDLVADGDRYFTGPTGRRLADVKSSGLANAECRVELVEMSGYESPFVERLHVFDHARRLRGYDNPAPGVTAYIRRRLLGGWVPLAWDGASKTYAAQSPRFTSSLLACNPRYAFAALPGPRGRVAEFLTLLNIYYGFVPGTIDAATRAWLDQERKVLYNAYALALCSDPSALPEAPSEPNHAPILKPLFKHVVHPGEAIRKEIIAVDLDDDPLTVGVADLPAGATYDAVAHRIDWVPAVGDAGVHVVTVSASDGQAVTHRPFPMIVKADAPAGPIPAAPTQALAALATDGTSVTLSWVAPAGVTVAAYVLYRDGALWAVVPPSQTQLVDAEALPGTSTRYHVALYATSGAESAAVECGPTYIRTPPQVPQASGGTPLWWLHVHGLLAGATHDEAEADDVDRDGHSALAEYIAGTDPNSAASRLAVLPSAVREGGFTLGWNGVAGRSYVVHRNLSFPRPEGWSTIAGPLPAAFDLSMQYSDANASDHVRACYRVAVRMP